MLTQLQAMIVEHSYSAVSFSILINNIRLQNYKLNASFTNFKLENNLTFDVIVTEFHDTVQRLRNCTRDIHIR